MSGTIDALERLIGDDRLAVAPWGDSADELAGHDPRSRYVERFWLPVLGPSTVFFLRYLAEVFDRAPGGTVLRLGDAARALGLGERDSRNSPFRRTIARAVDFGAAHVAEDALLVRRCLPPLAPRQLARLPEPLRLAHGNGVIAQHAWPRARRSSSAADATRSPIPRVLAG